MNMRKVPLLLAVALMMALAGSAFALAGKGDSWTGSESTNLLAMPSLTVCVSGCDHTSIQDAIDAATSGDTIDIQAGTYLENLTIDKDITLQGADQTTTIIDGQAQATVVTILSNITVTIADVTITNGFVDNEEPVSDDGGGIFNEGSLTVLNSTIKDNIGDDRGGGIFNSGTLSLSHSTVQNNTTFGEGAGVWNSGTLSLLHSTVRSNTTFGEGGAVWNIGTLTISDSTLENNSSEYGGGGILNENMLTVLNSTISHNLTTYRSGPGINNSGTFTLTNSIVSNNTGLEGTRGGGIYNTGIATIAGSTVDGNAVGTGGGIYNTNTLTLLDSVVSKNRTLDFLGPIHGSGIYNDDKGFMTLTNSTVSGNRLIFIGDNHRGGAIYNKGTIALNFSTISHNTIEDGEGSGLYNDGITELTNSIVANNHAVDECGGLAITSLGHNLDSDGSCNLNATGDQPNNDPLLALLADNGGPTFTHLPLAGSPAIDGGDCSASSITITSDQRGIARPQGTGCDIGSVEVEVMSTSCGGLIQEAEDGVLSGYFEIGHDRDASGGEYIHVPNGMGNRWNGPDSAHKADYCFTVETDGIYQIKGWIYAESGMDNSFFVRTLNSSANGFLWDFPKNTEYRMDDVSNRNGEDPVQVVLSAGKYPVEILLREDGARLDKLELQLIEPIDVNPPTCDDLLVEAEEGKRTGAFVIGEDSAASGGQYVYVPNGGGNSFDMPDPYQQVEYCFKVDSAGTYRIKGGIYATSGRDNSFFVKVDHAPSNGYLWDFPKNTIYQQDYVSQRNGADPVEVELSAGKHTVTIFLREDGARLDNLELELVSRSSAQTLASSSPPIARGLRGTLMVNDEQGQEELDLSGINLSLIDAATGGNEYNESTQTDHLGQYYFDEMPVGEYKLSLELPEGYSSSQPTEVEVSTNAEQMVEVSFDLQIAQERAIKIFLPLVIK